MGWPWWRKKLIQQKLDYAQRQNVNDKQKIDDFQRIVDESLQRTNSLLTNVQTYELTCEQLREQNQTIQHEYDQLLSTVSNLKTEIDKLQNEKQQMSQLQEQVLNRIKQDIEIKTNNQEENLLNTRLQQSVEELNSIMKDCIKQTELTNGTPAHIANLTKLEILYRQLQQRHQYDLEQHFAITESLRIKAKDAQNDVQKLERQCEEMRSKFHEEQMKSAAKIAELESKLRNADTTTVLTRLLPSATLENRLKEEEERTQQLRNWTNKLTEKIENIQKVFDAIGGARFDDGAGGDNEVQRTMLELINQLDGFDPRGNIKVLMATNRPDTLDPALVRPGRLDRKVEFNLPDLEGRTHIFKIHTKSMSVEKDIRYELLARLCPNSTGAELRSVCTEAGMFAIRARRKIATEKDFIEAVNKVIKAYAKFSSTPRYMTYN
ncbi:unnamed protein product [Rotaria sp. Silwood1]|nr:unnamed protein product [Rotaria sp. Silwood1]